MPRRLHAGRQSVIRPITQRAVRVNAVPNARVIQVRWDVGEARERGGDAGEGGAVCEGRVDVAAGWETVAMGWALALALALVCGMDGGVLVGEGGGAVGVGGRRGRAGV